jgi:hypothetical protein
MSTEILDSKIDLFVTMIANKAIFGVLLLNSDCSTRCHFVFKIAVSAVVYGVIMLFCPLSHLLMMKFIGHDHGQTTNKHNHSPALDTDVK